jgi:tRNA-2-methylthio-N6-dimethylallyladenosine synthase
VTVEVTHGAPHHLVADSALRGGPFEVRRTRSGDAWQARRDGVHDHGVAAPDGPVALGMPALR